GILAAIAHLEDRMHHTYLLSILAVTALLGACGDGNDRGERRRDGRDRSPGEHHPAI
ncbi:MAG: hypothetical protein GX465_11510, partial [Acidobacteria bacterium]|nr:hypothetical protein [Acidobacteriota bacterium]